MSRLVIAGLELDVIHSPLARIRAQVQLIEGQISEMQQGPIRFEIPDRRPVAKSFMLAMLDEIKKQMRGRE